MLLFYKIKETLSGFTSLKEPVNFFFRHCLLGSIISHPLLYLCYVNSEFNRLSNVRYILRKDKGYKRMGAVGTKGHYKHFRKPWKTWFVNPPVWLFPDLPVVARVNSSKTSSRRENSFIPLRKRWSTVKIDGNLDLTAWKNNPTSFFTKAFLLKGR